MSARRHRFEFLPQRFATVDHRSLDDVLVSVVNITVSGDELRDRPAVYLYCPVDVVDVDECFLGSQPEASD